MVNLHSPSTILPPTSLRDIVLFIFILNYLPNSVNSVILITYILSGSTKFIGGQLIIKYVNLKFKFEKNALDSTNLHYVSKLLVLFSQVLVINSVILWLLFKMFPILNVKYLTTLSKSILACELIGSSSLRNSSTITSVVQSTSNPALTNASSSDLAANHTTTTTTTTSIKKSNLHIKINKVILDNNFLKVLFCFTVVISINFLVDNYLIALDYGFIAHSLRTKDLAPVFSHKVFKSADSIFSHPKFLFLTHTWFRYGNRNAFSRKLVKLINYIYINLCLHVITLKINPLLKKTILLKNYSNKLDHLSNLTPVVPIDFKRNTLLHDRSKDDMESDLINEQLHEELPIISLKEEEPDEEVIDVKLAPKISESDVVVKNIVPTSISIKNFEIFCITPFKHQLSNLNINSSLNMYFKSKFDNSKFKPNSTMIIDKSLSFVTLIQPFWSLLAACKTMIKDPGSFNGNSTIYKNKGGRFLVGAEGRDITLSKLLVSVKLINDTIIVLKVLNDYDLLKLRVRLNCLDWQHFQICEDGDDTLIKVFSLSPYFQYEIELLDDEDLISYIIVNTVSSSLKTVLAQSPMVTPLMTLQSSLISTMEELNQVKSNLKKFKKDENKKQADYKRDNEILVKKIEKFDSNNDNNAKKLENLKQIINQYENEIKEIQQKLDFQSNNESYEIKKSKIMDELEQVNMYVKDSEGYLMKSKKELKQVEDEYSQITLKGNKLKSKKQFKTQELHQLENDINNLKKTGFIFKINKRYKKINEKFETILPRIKSAINEMSKIED